MDPRHLLQLSVIFEKGSLTAAAKALSLSQSTLTRNMATLEMQAGMPLFERSRHGVRSTAMGELLAREGRTIATSVRTAREHVSRHKIGFTDQLRIGTGTLLGMSLMPPVLERLITRHPHLTMSVAILRPLDGIDQLIDGRLDIVVAPAAFQRNVHGVSHSLLAEDRLGVFCGPTHPLAKAKERRISDFQRASWLSLGLASPFEHEIIKMLSESGVPTIRTQMVLPGDASLLVQMLLKGRHLAVLPHLPISLMPPGLRLVELPLPNSTTYRSNISVWYRDEIAETPAAVRFRQTIQDVLREMRPAAE